MGLLIEGEWQEHWYETKKHGGHFVRPSASFRAHIGPDSDHHPAASGRYRLYVSYACPWASRTLIARALKGLEEHVSVFVVEALMLEGGWRMEGDSATGARFLHELYTRTNPKYTGRVTVPVLWDTEREVIVNNESSEILRMLNSALDGWGDPSVDLYPKQHRAAIDEINEVVYHAINNGVYRAGFATTQEAYEEAYDALFAALDQLEERLAGQRYLVGDQPTEADWRLFTTLVRFDAVYYGHFKCNRQRLSDYPNLWAYTRELYQTPGVAATVNMAHIKGHYFASHRTINPSGVVPKGPVLDFLAPHDRGTLDPKRG